MSRETHFVSGEIAPRAGVYQEHNVFGTPTGRHVNLGIGEALPTAPVGFTWTYVGTAIDPD